MPDTETTAETSGAPPDTVASDPAAPAAPEPKGGPGDPSRPADLRRTYRRRRLAAAGVVVVVAAALVAPVYAVFDGDSTRSVRADTAAASASLSSTRRATTAAPTTVTPTTAAPTTVTPTTAAPTTVTPEANGTPAAAPVAGINVGPLSGGPGPIPVVHRIPTSDPVVFITIDDGVTPEPAALDVIRARQVPVTLFLTQNFVPRAADYFRSLQAAGATIESHSITHQNLRGKDEPTQQREVCGPTPQYTELFGTPPELFRPPYGDWDDTTVRVAAGCGMKAVVHWSATFDGGTLSTAGGPLRPGDIILLHFKPGLGINLSVLLDQIAAAGLRPARLADYVRSAPPTPAPVPGAPATTAPAVPPEPSPLPEAVPPAA